MNKGDAIDAIRERLIATCAVNERGAFWPAKAVSASIGGVLTVERHLRYFGLAQPDPSKSGYWVLTEAGGNMDGKMSADHRHLITARELAEAFAA